MRRPPDGHPGPAPRLRALRRGAVVGLLAVPPALALTGVLAVGAASAPTRHGSAASPSSSPAAAPSASSASPASPASPAGHTAPDVRTVVGMGDSVPAGAVCGCEDFVHQLADGLRTDEHLPVSSANLAVGGATAADVADQLSDPATRARLADADLVVLTVGANDLEGAGDPTACAGAGEQDADTVVAACYGPQLSQLEDDLDRLLAAVTAAARRPGIRVLVTGYWNVFLDGAVGRSRGAEYVELADAATRAVNDRIEAAARGHGATYVDLVVPFRGSDGSRDCTALLASDGDHPNAEGHAVIARTLRAALAA